MFPKIDGWTFDQSDFAAVSSRASSSVVQLDRLDRREDPAVEVRHAPEAPAAAGSGEFIRAKRSGKRS